MRLRYLLFLMLSVIIIAPSSQAQSCADWSCFITNRNVIADPDYAGKIPAAGITFASIDGFSTPATSIMRVTDQNTCPASVMGHNIGSAPDSNPFNYDGTRFITQTTGSGVIPWTRNKTTGAIARVAYVAGLGRTGFNACESGTPTYLELSGGTPNPLSSGTPTWGYTAANKDILFVVRSISSQAWFAKLDFTNLAAGYTNIKNVSACGAPWAINTQSNDLTIDKDDLYLMMPGVGGGQDSWTSVVVVRISDGLCRYLNTNTMTVSGDFGATGAASITGPSGTCKIHNARMGREGTYVILSTASCTGSILAGGRIIWDWQTVNVDTSCNQTAGPQNGCGGHWSSGSTYAWSSSSTAAATWDFRNGERRTLPNTGVTYPVSPTFTGGGGISDGYFSTPLAGAAPPMHAMYVKPATFSLTPPALRGEITLLSGTGYIRITKLCSNANDFYNEGKATIAQDSSAFMWVSNLAICNANQSRNDVYLIAPPVTGAAAPTISSVAPTSGTYLGGTAVTAAGTNFVSGATLSFDGVVGTSCVFNSSISVTCNTAGHVAAVVDVTVTNPDAQSATLAASYTYTGSGAPTISSVAPATGSFLGGTPMSIIGTNFAQGAAVTVAVGGLACVNLTVPSTTQIYCITQPSTTLGLRDVVVTNPGGATATAPNAFTYTNVIVTGVATPH